MEMSSSSDTAKIVQPEGRNNDNTSKIAVLCAILAAVIALVALILGIVAIAGGSNQYYIGTTGSGDETTSSSDKTWLFQIGHFVGNNQYLDEESGTIKGYDVDVVNAVCQIANKNCRLTWDVYERCWDSQPGQRARGGPGLMGGWYDACIGWVHTIDRGRTFQFSAPFASLSQIFFWVKQGSSFNYPDLTNLKVGFLDGWYADEHCLARYPELVGFDQTDANQVKHYPNEDQMAAALRTDEIDVAFATLVPEDIGLNGVALGHTPSENKCLFGGLALMMPKDETELPAWFNAGFENLRATSEYRAICDNINKEHGDQPGESADDICLD